MKKSISLLRGMAMLACLSIISLLSGKTVSAVPVLETTVSEASEDCTMLGVYGSYYSEAQAALNRINEIRKEACTAGNVPDPRNSSRMLTASDYVPIKWSKDLESIARIRAMEGGLAFGFLGSGHNRLNGESIWGVSYGGVSSHGEVLAYNYGKSMVQGVNQWYGEKSDWVNQTGAVTGHYTMMIDPGNTYVGLGDFYTQAASYPNTVAGAFSSTSKSLSTTMQPAQEDVIQKIEVLNSYITGYVLEGNDTIYTDETTTLTPRVTLQNGSKQLKLWLVDSVTYSSSDTSVAEVNSSGVVTGLRNGKTTITVKLGSAKLATMVVTVKCNHAKELKSETSATCTKTGVKKYGCKTCGGTIEQEIPKTEHNYVYGDADSAGYRTGKCSGCGKTIKIIPPTNFSLYWSETGSGYYYSSFPSTATIGDTIYCWLYGVNGDSEYRDMVIETTDASVVSVPENPVANSSRNQIKLLAPGIATLTFYPKYNPGLKKTLVIRLGNTGSVNIAVADVKLSKTSYKYTGSACTPSVTVSYHDTELTPGTDYKVTYQNNVKKGTATVVIKGCGIFKGTIRKNFTIGGTGNSATKKKPLAVGKTFVASTLTYKVVKSDAKKGTYQVSCTKPKSKNITKVTMPSYVTYKGVKYKVVSVDKKAFANCKKLKTVTLPSTITSIGSKAFANCKALNTITIKSKSLTTKKVGADAFKGIKEKVTIKVPEKKFSAYKNILRKKGVSKKAQFKKII